VTRPIRATKLPLGKSNPKYEPLFSNLLDHPFEAMLLELGIKQRYTRPYRPQTTDELE
jgi:transposase